MVMIYSDREEKAHDEEFHKLGIQIIYLFIYKQWYSDLFEYLIILLDMCSLFIPHTSDYYMGESHGSGPKMLECIIEFVTLLFFFIFQENLKKLMKVQLYLLCLYIQQSPKTIHQNKTGVKKFHPHGKNQNITGAELRIFEFYILLFKHLY